ncbi:hypothetical protein IU500_28075 [Nocardia terpenica]|uniref:hypothetical protein n=1 Tax=Nocardia terpenica TaxID=455432 RepID=UPI0018934F1F|nr:hypothetical protein [Nocardia terpenica]MBF6065144.1 hypothetical protein [Nocardia terpenica]MBF6107872.1 hypothetical protein [Nocardia terpenica]MBF6115597.1 hypothetical protein [Nocardia terpenica]MBF6122034.1 hypothetical protein [Nocardia terpenica]MBF6155422.1 hypothetical protein [Nocardia terpenica]
MIGWRGIFLVVYVVICYLFISHPGPLWPIVGLPIALVQVVRFWGVQRRPAKVRPWDQVVGPLVRSREEYCLILRPFGEDGTKIFRFQPKNDAPLDFATVQFINPTMTLEQVIARTVEHALGLKAYALVDQSQLLAPPGPVWLRTQGEHDQWKLPVEALIQRAHTIFLIFPPGQEIRDSVKWEIEQITARDLQSRVVIVLPSSPHADANRTARRQLSIAMATFDSFCGDVEDADLTTVERYERELPENVLLVKAVLVKKYDRLIEWMIWRGNEYTKTISEALAITNEELSDLNFRQRYPWALPPLPIGLPLSKPKPSGTRLMVLKAKYGLAGMGILSLVLFGFLVCILMCGGSLALLVLANYHTARSADAIWTKIMNMTFFTAGGVFGFLFAVRLFAVYVKLGWTTMEKLRERYRRLR